MRKVLVYNLGIIFIFIILFFSNIEAYYLRFEGNFFADSIVLSRGEYIKFEKFYESINKKTLGFQVYFSKLWPIAKGKLSKRFINSVKLNKLELETYINVLKAEYDWQSIEYLILLHQDINHDPSLFWKQYLEALLYQNKIDILLNKIEYYSYLNYDIDFLIDLLYKIKEKEIKFNRNKYFTSNHDETSYLMVRYFYIKLFFDDIYLKTFIKSHKEDLNFIKFVINKENKDIGNFKFFSYMDSILSDKIKNKLSLNEVFYLDLSQNRYDKIILYLNNLGIKEKKMFLHIYLKDLLFNREYSEVIKYLNVINKEEYDFNLYKYYFSISLIKNEIDSFFYWIDVSRLSKNDKAYFYYWIAILFLTDSTEKFYKYSIRLKKEFFYTDYFKQFLLIAKIIRETPSNLYNILYTGFYSYLTYDTLTFFKNIDKLKSISIDYEILFSLLESDYKSIKYDKDKLYFWYDNLRNLPEGRYLIILSECFFTEKDLLEYYKKKIEEEKDPVWRDFYKSRIYSISNSYKF